MRPDVRMSHMHSNKHVTQVAAIAYKSRSHPKGIVSRPDLGFCLGTRPLKANYVVMYSLRSRNVALKDVSALSQVSRDLNRGKKRQHISLEYESEESKPNEQKQGDQDQDVGHEIREAVKAVKCESADGKIKHPLSMDSVKIKVESGDTSYRACRFSATSLPLAAQVKKPRGIVKLEPVSSEIAFPGPPPVVGEHCMNHALVERPGVIVKQEPMTDGFTPQTIPNFFTNDPCMNLPPILPYPGQPFIKTEPSGCSPHVPYSVTGETFPHGMTFPQGFAFADGQFVKPEPVSAIPHYYPAPFQAEHILKGGMDVKTEGAASFADESSPKKSKPGTSRKKTIKMEEESGDTTVWEPPLWKEQLANIVKMREKRDAPVDIEGAHKNAASLDLVTPEVCVCMCTWEWLAWFPYSIPIFHSWLHQYIAWHV